MAVALVPGEALAASFLALYNAVKEVNDCNLMFKNLFEDIKSILDSIHPLIKIMEYDKALDFPKEELQNWRIQMGEGVEIICKYSKIGLWNTQEIDEYTSKLFELSKSLRRLLDILQVHGLSKKNIVPVKNLETVEQQIEGSLIQTVTEPLPIAVGLDTPLKDLKIKILNDGVSLLVLTAPGGCGKTTLAKKFCQDGEVKAKFKNNIFFVTVSKKPNLNLIVQELYQRKGSQISSSQSEVISVNLLQEFLKQTGENPLLLVLDDVWSESESIVDMFTELKMPSYKILVTSRFTFPRFGSPYYLEPLNDEDAMTLLNHSASLGDGSSDIPQDLKRKIVEHCKGFPLAITVVGRSLWGQPVANWQKRLAEWTKDSSILDFDNDLLVCLRSSLDASEKESAIIKEFFEDLGSFPEDRRIPVITLIDILAELYEIGNDILCFTIVNELTKRNLANLIVTKKDNMEMDGYYSEHFVTLHDILRELAIYQAGLESVEQRNKLIIDVCGDNLPSWWAEQKYQHVSAHLLSISTDGDFTTQWPNMQLPEAKVLILNFQTEKYTLPEFVDKMEKLKVLIVTNYGHLPAELYNFPLLGSLSNLKRIRFERISISSICKNPVQLESLKKISLFMCKMGQAFSNCSIQLIDVLPNVVEMNIDYCNDMVELPAMLCALVSLEKLSITNSHKLCALPEDIGNLVNLQVLRLRSCTELSAFPDSIQNLKLLKLLDISDCFSIKELPEHIGAMCSLETLNMRQCSRLQELPGSVVDLEQLKDVICDSETEILWKPFLPFLHNIHIRVVKEDINLNWLHKFPS